MLFPAFRALGAGLLLLAAGLVPARADDPYVRPEAVNLVRLLPPPPALDSETLRQEADILLSLQEARTPDMVAEARADVELKLARFSRTVGTDLSPERAPRATALIDKAKASMGPILGQAKNHWHLPRPYDAFPEIQPALPRETSFAYPSGHATWATMVGIILASMLPEKAGLLFARADQFGFEREIGGVHYPADVAAGRIAGTVLAAMMMDDAQFQQDFALAAHEVRALLDLPPLPANDLLPQGVAPPQGEPLSRDQPLPEGTAPPEGAPAVPAAAAAAPAP